jgi:glycine/sarcosine N-methyltransferase
MDMVQAPVDFYDALAEHYHLLFEDWNQSIERQGAILNAILRSVLPRSPLRVLDCACGMGTQAIGLAQAGHHVVASDLSPSALARARREADQRGLEISFVVSDMTSLAEIEGTAFDVVAVMDNALPHLTSSQLAQAARAMGSKLKPQGVLIASIRDYDRLIVDRPIVQGPAFYGAAGTRRIVHQVWDWIDMDRYVFHLYITQQSGETWGSHHFASEYRCLLRGELTFALNDAGFRQVRWLMPAESGYYQPIVVATKEIA